MIPRSSIAVLLAALLPAAPSAVRAVSNSFDSLLNNNPFGPQSGAAGPSAGAPAGDSTSLEFRGMLVENGAPLFSLNDPSTRTSGWFGLNEKGGAFKVLSYDEAKGMLTVEYQGRTTSLLLKKATLLVQAPPPPPPRPVDRQIDPSASLPVPVRTPEELARIAKINETIKKAREERLEAAKAKSRAEKELRAKMEADAKAKAAANTGTAAGGK